MGLTDDLYESLRLEMLESSVKRAKLEYLDQLAELGWYKVVHTLRYSERSMGRPEVREKLKEL